MELLEHKHRLSLIGIKLDIAIGGFALLGVQDVSLLTFLHIYYRYRRNRRIITYRGTQWVKKKV